MVSADLEGSRYPWGSTQRRSGTEHGCMHGIHGLTRLGLWLMLHAIVFQCFVLHGLCCVLQVLLPLHAPSGMISQRTQEPLLQLYGPMAFLIGSC